MRVWPQSPGLNVDGPDGTDKKDRELFWVFFCCCYFLNKQTQYSTGTFTQVTLIVYFLIGLPLNKHYKDKTKR